MMYAEIRFRVSNVVCYLAYISHVNDFLFEVEQNI